MGTKRSIQVTLYCDYCAQPISGNSITHRAGSYLLNFHNEQEKEKWIEEHYQMPSVDTAIPYYLRCVNKECNEVIKASEEECPRCGVVQLRRK